MVSGIDGIRTLLATRYKKCIRPQVLLNLGPTISSTGPLNRFALHRPDVPHISHHEHLSQSTRTISMC